MLIIQPIGGLCNRMRAINSSWMLAKERGDKLLIIWNINKELGCPFEEIFEPNDQFRILNIRSKWNVWKLFHQFSSQFISNDTIRENKVDGLLTEDFRKNLQKKIYIATEEHFYPCHSYELFHPQAMVQKRIDAMTAHFGAHAVGVHIRRTDNKPAIGKSSTDSFITSMEAELSLHPDTMFYLATDDRSEEAKLRKQFPDCILSNQNRDLSRDSVAGIQDAMVDLYVLANTQKIIGSFFSSFTDIAADMHQIPKIIAGETNQSL